MPTILDSNVILDLLYPESEWNGWSRHWFARCTGEAPMVINAVVFSESFATFAEASEAVMTMNALGLTYEALSAEAAHRAGNAHAAYRKRGGLRHRTLADFLIGAHAATAGHAILTRDGARYRSYFPALKIIAPDTHP